MNIRDMAIDQLKEGIIRCKDRLAWNNYGLMKTIVISNSSAMSAV